MLDFKKIGQWGSQNLVGILALLAGFFAIYLTSKIILNIIVFFLGISLIYFALVRLNVKVVTDFIDKWIKNIKDLFQKR